MKAKVIESPAPRIIEVDVRSLGIISYDIDNAYPQRMREFKDASSTTKQAVSLYAKYIRGAGFADQVFYKAVINKKGLTADKLLRRISDDFAEMRGIAVHVNYNALFQKIELKYIPFENCRLTAPDGDYYGKIALHPDWGKRDKRTKISNETIDYIDRYNPKPEVILQQVEKAGGWENYKGQVFWLSADYENYPLASFDAVIESAKAEIESDKTTTSNLKNNFTAKSIYVVKGKFEDDEERETEVNNLKAFVGPDGAQLMLVELKDDEEKPELIEVKSNLNDKLFEYTDNKVLRKIIRYFNQPAILHSITDGGYFNQQQLQDAMNYYNGVTQDERVLMEEIFTELCSGFVTELNPSGNYQITPFGTTSSQKNESEPTNN